jgi:cyclophilin family peptidyl-prolyl cis-trans isomerase
MEEISMNKINRGFGIWGAFSALALAVCTLAGCSKGADEKPTAANSNTSTQPPASAQPSPATQTGTDPQPVMPPPPVGADKNAEDNANYTLSPAELHQSFKDATTKFPPEGAQRPPDETAAGKKVPDLLRKITGENGTGGLWDLIRFISPEGKHIHYQAVVKTDLGEFTITLLPDSAPNHARSFIALAKAGYFDGLAVDSIFKQADPKSTILAAGCPLKLGDIGYGSIGYWLKPELSDKYKDVEGAVGAWPLEKTEPLESAACKFYISLNEAPGNAEGFTIFGRVSQGLDVVRKISLTPQQKYMGQETGFPVEPITIHSIRILERS